jgi:hypothetical protein
MNQRTLREKLYRAMKRLPSSFILVIIVPAAICLYLYSAHFPVAGFFYDDGGYIVNAKSIYEGAGYSIASLPGSPPQTRHPPVFPLILSLCWHINPSFPENIVLMRLFSALCAVLVLFMAFFYLRLKSSYHPHPALPLEGGRFGLYAFLFLSALAFNPDFAFFSGQILSEVPFTLFSLASIVLFLHYERSGRKSSLYGSLLLATIAFYTRTIGIALFVSFVLWFLCQRRLKSSLWALALMLCAIVPWFYWGYENSASTSSLPAYYGSYFSWFLTSRSSLFSYLPNFFILFTLPSLLFLNINAHPISLSVIFSIILVISFWLFFLGGILYQLRKAPSVDALYLIVTIIIVALWLPGFSRRYFVPLLPIVLFYLMEGVKAVREDVATFPLSCRKVGRRLWQAGVCVLLVGIYILGITQTAAIIRNPFHNSNALFLHVKEACNWISKNTEKEDVIASSLDPLVYLFSGRSAVNVALNPFKPENPYDEDDILVAIKKCRVNYLLTLYIEPWFENKLRNKKLSEIIKKYPAAFHKCYEKERVFAVYRVERQSDPFRKISSAKDNF